MGSRNSRSLVPDTQRFRQDIREVSAPGMQSSREGAIVPSELIEAGEQVAVVDTLVSSDFCDDAGAEELVSAQTEWVTEVTLPESQIADEVLACDLEPPSFPDRSHEIIDLHQQLNDKDELISTLVGELEQVVEQLDRMQRSGGSRSQLTSASGSMLPIEVVEEHQQVLGDLQRVVEQWEALQASSVLGRIEAEVSELRSMMAHGSSFHITADASRQEAAAPESQLDDVLSRLAIDHKDRGVSDTQSNGASWESIKRRMMGGEEPAKDSVPTPSEVEEIEVVDLQSVVAPRPVDLDAATHSELQLACAERDGYIVQLTRMLRSRGAVSLPDNWDDIVEVPEEQKARVDQLATRLEEQVRLAEVEMSLERARLSRERTQVMSEQEKIEKHLKRLGLASLDELESVAVENGSNSDRRWMRFLGVNRRS